VCGGGGGGIVRILVLALRAVLGVFDVSRGLGASNAAVAIFGGRVLSLSEDDMPYVLDVADGDGDVRTLGRLELPSKINLCAHPKIDPATGDMYAFGLGSGFPFSYSVFRVSARGGARITSDAPVPLPDLPLVHDFAVTPRFVVFPDGQLVVRPSALAVGRSPLACDFAKTPRFCLLPKHDGLSSEHSTANARFFDAPGVNCLHCLNAWDDDHEVVLVAPVLSPPEHILVIPQNTASHLTEIRFDTMTGGVKRRAICSDLNLEFGVINPEYSGHKTRFAYMGCGSYPYFDAVVKVDLTRYGGEDDEQGPIVGRQDFGEGMFGGEPFFLAAKDANSEDHGYILCLVGDRKAAQASKLWVMDALSPSLEIIAVIELPARVPIGFHGCFIGRDQLAQ
jgi:9-cis-epoxycarotenoid dioxygenase